MTPSIKRQRIFIFEGSPAVSELIKIDFNKRLELGGEEFHADLDETFFSKN